MPCGRKYFLKFSSGVLFNCGLFYPQNFSWRQRSIFHLNVIGRKTTKLIICNGLVCFELALV